MKFYDVFNGDADGLCALLQLRLAHPRDSVLVTGVKRDIRLLERIVAQPGDDIAVLDVSLAANLPALKAALEAGAQVTWFDHHQSANIPSAPALRTHIDTDPGICTSLIVNRHLKEKFQTWAIVGAFGDNLIGSAQSAAHREHLRATDAAVLKDLGTCLNYNAYGESVADLRYHPADLFREMRTFADPIAFVHETTVFRTLQEGMHSDLECSEAAAATRIGPKAKSVVFPNAAWSRRVVGVYANRLAQSDPDSAHAVLVEKPGGYLVSIRAPLAQPRGASRVASEFHSGGGREGAAGIDFLPTDEIDRFLVVMRMTFDDAAR